MLKRVLRRPERFEFLIFSGIALVCIVLLFWRAAGYGFFVIDDADTVTRNPVVKHFNLVKMFTGYSLEFIPLTFLTFAIEHGLVGMNAVLYHIDNVLLHALVTILIGLLCRLLFPGQRALSLLIMLFFAVHPLHVEPTVWISSRKDLLYSFFYLLAVTFYWKYLKQTSKGPRYFCLSALMAGLSLLSKGAAITLPAAFLLLDLYENRRRDKWMFWDKLPVTIMVIWVAYTHLISHNSIALMTDQDYSFWAKGLEAGKALVFYISKTLWPVGLSVYYQNDAFSLSSFDLVLCGLGIVWAFWVYVKFPQDRRKLFFAIAWFLVTLSPYLKLVPYGRDYMVADRYLYLPSFGLFYILARPLTRTYLGFFLAGVILCGFIFLSYERIGLWQNPRAMVDDVLAKYPRTGYAYELLGILDQRAGRTDQAIEDYQKTLEIEPGKETALYNLATIYLGLGKYDKAIEYLKTTKNPLMSATHVNLAYAYMQIGKNSEAIEELKAATSLDPHGFVAYYNLANLYKSRKEYENAILMLNRVIELQPEWRPPYLVLADIYNATGQTAKAAAMYRESLSKKDTPDEAN